MYSLSDKQIDHILNDISARGVEMESLQQNLLDHVCCIIEQNFEANGDFESFYQKTIQTFYKTELWEIEEETISLLTFKNYYVMKRSMLISGTISVIFLTIGIIFKFLHWPGASMGVVLGLGLLSLVFLPLMFVLKIREKQATKDKLVIAFGAFAGVLISLGILFKLQHWPWANSMITCSMAVMLLLFLPFYFFSGIRNPETKVNTLVSSIILVAACGLLLALVRTPRSSRFREKMMTETYLRSQDILHNELKRSPKSSAPDSTIKNSLGKEVFELCENIKSRIIELETGSRSIETDFYNNDLVIGDHSVSGAYSAADLVTMTGELSSKIKQYAATVSTQLTENKDRTLTTGMFLEFYRSSDLQAITIFETLQQLTQIQLFVLQNERKLLAGK